MSRPELLERYRELPLPSTSEESWRFTDLKGFDPDAFAADGASEVASAPGMLELEAAGIVRVSQAGLELERVPEGVRFERLEHHPRLGQLVGSHDKFTAHNAAMWEHGLLVHVPPGVELEQPLYVRIVNDVDGGSLFWRLLVVADPGSRFTVIEEYASTRPELSGYVNAAVEIFVEQGAKVEYVSVQNVSRETWHFGTHHARVERDAELDWVAGGFGSKKGKIRIQNDLAGTGATSRVTGAYFADGHQHLDYDTFQEHIAPNTTSDFAFKGALRDDARAVWRGMIRVEKDAQRTNAYQENRNLLLSKTAHADSIPGLEILANDVRCTHGATLGQVDREQLFYLMARGLSRQEAERLIVRGFFQDVLDRIELEPVREALGAALEARIPQA
ncbi:MAG TPA: Fe-S cluster assembly protein SufD [Gaiellaceae bacterium]|jgi:Fe-S cluster assembly protein SufD|nr:Fe-S cluster assembly protein SufD [Gaiellaceae bacterium]